MPTRMRPACGSARDNPAWYHNVVAWPDEVTVQAGAEPFAATVRLVEGQEYERWCARCIAVFAP